MRKVNIQEPKCIHKEETEEYKIYHRLENITLKIKDRRDGFAHIENSIDYSDLNNTIYTLANLMDMINTNNFFVLVKTLKLKRDCFEGAIKSVRKIKDEDENDYRSLRIELKNSIEEACNGISKLMQKLK